VYKIRHVTV